MTEALKKPPMETPILPHESRAERFLDAEFKRCITAARAIAEVKHEKAFQSIPIDADTGARYGVFEAMLGSIQDKLEEWERGK